MEVSVYDFDGTLFRGDSFRRSALNALGLPRFLWGIVQASPWLVAWKAGLYSGSAAKEKLFTRWYAGCDIGWFEEAGREFGKVIERRLFPNVYLKMQDDVAAGHTVVIASASYRQWIEPWALSKGVSAVIASEPEVKDGVLTGCFDSRGNCVGAEKARRVKEMLADADDITVYTDSRADEPLLALATRRRWVTGQGKITPLN